MLKITTLRSTMSLTGALAQDVPTFLRHHGCPRTAQHCAAVAAQAIQLTRRFAVNCEQATPAAWLHDVSAVIPAAERLPLARAWALEVLPAEEAVPMLLHQKLSAVFAEQLFAVTDPVILSAIACHTTLKPYASDVDKVVFLADKIAWDQPGIPPYLAALWAALEHSLDAGVRVYLDHLWMQRATLPVIHPWFVAARGRLKM